MYHFQPSRPRRKPDYPIRFHPPTAEVEREEADQHEHLMPDAQDVLASADEETVPTPPHPEVGETHLGAVDLRLLSLLVWWMQQQGETETAAQMAAEVEPRVVESVRVEQITDNPPARQRRVLPWPLILLVGCSACLVALLLVVIGSLLAVPTTITILPTQMTLASTSTVRIATGTTTASTPEVIPGRLLPTLTLSQARTIPTTGIGHQAAQAARGAVTFYNAALVAQTVPAGTRLVGADGVQIVTEQEAVLPAAQLPTEGQATVSAQAVQQGPQGNIGAGDLHGACCRADVFATNSIAFTGGQQARTYQVVTQQDLDSAVATLATALAESIQAAYSAQLATNEVLVTPVPCASVVSRTHMAGNEAKAVTVTLTNTCMGVAYDEQALVALLTTRMTEQAHAQLGSTATLLGALEVTTQQVKQQGGTLILTVYSSGVWAYQFSEAELHHLAELVAGTSAQQATALLLHQPGVSEVALNTSTLPSNPDQIRMLVVYH